MRKRFIRCFNYLLFALITAVLASCSAKPEGLDSKQNKKDMTGKNMEKYSLTILDKQYVSNEKFPYSLGATGVFCIPVMPKYKKDYAAAKADGLLTTAHLSLCYDPLWVEKNPDAKSVFYWLSEITSADASELRISLTTEDYMYNQFKLKPLNMLYDPKKYWRVYDRTAKKILDPGEWEKEEDKDSIIIKSIQGHKYQAAFLVYDVEKKGWFEHCYLDPRNPAFGIIPAAVATPEEIATVPLYPIDPLSEKGQKYTLQKLEIFLKEWSGYVDIIRISVSCRYTTFMDKEKALYGGWDENGEKVPGWNWYGYGRFVHPENQAEFKKETGYDFDIEWLLKSKYGQIKYPPTMKYLAWIEFISRKLMDYHVKISELCASYGVKIQTNIGDNWIGTEPYLDDFEKPGFDSIAMYFLGKPVANKMLLDFDGKTRRVLKVWFKAEAGGKHYSGENAWKKLISDWNNSKRTLFFRLPDELRFELLTEKAPQKTKDAALQIVKEFDFYKKYIGGADVYRHPLNIYILNCWGKLRAWSGWGDDCGISQNIIQSHLVDMPFNIKWISFKEISRDGIPKDCDIIFNFGAMGTSWSGDYMWKLPNVKSRIEGFVRQGGAFLGIGASGFFDGKSVISDMMELIPADKNVKEEAWLYSKKTQEHWISRELPETLNLKGGLKIKSNGTDASSLYSSGDCPVVYVKEFGKGRVGYINGYNDTTEYYKLLKKMFFWLSKREDLSEALNTKNSDVFLYFYPKEKILIVYNMSDIPQKIHVTLDPALFAGAQNENIKLYDIRENKEITGSPFSSQSLKKGIDIATTEWEAKFLKIVTDAK